MSDLIALIGIRLAVGFNVAWITYGIILPWIKYGADDED